MSGWFEAARFGMFIHWGHSSQRGIELSWPMAVRSGSFGPAQTAELTVDEYHATARTFDPQHWDARDLARRAKACGMQYGVFTTKHHDGFSMFHTTHSDFSIEHAPFRRDIVREYVDAFRAEGLRVGLYYSLSDWHHPDYPALTEADKPYGVNRWPKAQPATWERYLEFLFGQIRELLTNYGQIDLIWFDGGWERSPEQWRAAELAKMIRDLQPGIVMNNRLPGQGDYETPEQFVPPQPLARPWETCMTLNESWAWNPADTAWKSPRRLIHTLCEVAGKGGNLLLNVGPTGDGSLPQEAVERLDAIAGWMARNGESIAGTVPGLAPWQCYGPSTRRSSRVYVHLLMRPYDSVTLRGVRTRRLRTARALSTGEELRFTSRVGVIDAMFNPDPLGEITIETPARIIDEHATVLALDFEGEPA